ncbi:amino acid ABC transporter permease [Bacillus sp. FJAT-27986]|uniref:amino acid ABC transporter permease n=1 Tax=Bacillus sp. FJAT-27986 TaxID=1743146 RepID=UPI00080AD9A0|nr:amino acid ABC transporter permease [Bacillus sp. FJAT-27986]OCA84786.1 glutamine ABC transporter permease [Bacillus sp. FJAT-27986]
MDFAGAYTPDNLKFLVDGFLVTLKVAVISIILSFIIGGILGIIRYAKIPLLSKVVAVIVETIRNLPLILIIFFVYFGLQDPSRGWSLNMSVTTAAIMALTIFESAMISEIIRSGLNSVPKGQIEAARSSGLNYMQTLIHIILPQALRNMVPPIVSQFISLLKDTSLAVIIALPELTHNGQIIYAQNGNYIYPILLLVALMYFVVNYGLSLVARRLEIKRA